tara:strand:- start:2736 stop:2939 length:204 start_codon:yes stop_codon:yes gene_type:complete
LLTIKVINIMQITQSQVEYWLGTNKPLDEAIDTLVDIANGKYDPETFKEEVFCQNIYPTLRKIDSPS